MAAGTEPHGWDGGEDIAAVRHNLQHRDQRLREGGAWQLAQGLVTEMAERTVQQNTITYSAAIRLARGVRIAACIGPLG